MSGIDLNWALLSMQIQPLVAPTFAVAAIPAFTRKSPGSLGRRANIDMAARYTF
jgi:hypothetical protein